MDHREFYDLVPEACVQMEKSAFLTVEGKSNPMTIGWAYFGCAWGKPIVTVMVRKSRYTYDLIEKSGTFTVSVPKFGEMAKELAYCGSHSGRDVNKIAETGLKMIPARNGGADAVAGCGEYFECRIVYKQTLDIQQMDAAIRDRFYGENQAFGNGDPHVLYCGEVLGAYRG